MDKIKKFFAEHSAILQFVKFTLISMIAGVSELVTFLLLGFLLPKFGVNSPVDWFVFKYSTQAGGLGALIAFLISATVGQVISFVVNFKKTFNSTNNVVVSSIGYAIMAILIIVGLNTYIGGLLNDALVKAMPNYEGLASFFAKAICQFSSFVIVFPMNKFVIMRNNGKKKDSAETAEVANNETTEKSEAQPAEGK